MEIELKQYVIVPKKPKMSKGKIASQVCHATFMALEKQKDKINILASPDADGNMCDRKAIDVIEPWKESGMCVIVLECEDTTQLMGIAKYLEQWKVPHHLYIDEGMTEIPMGTATALATGVLSKDYHWMLSQLKTLR